MRLVFAVCSALEGEQRGGQVQVAGVVIASSLSLTARAHGVASPPHRLSL